MNPHLRRAALVLGLPVLLLLHLRDAWKRRAFRKHHH